MGVWTDEIIIGNTGILGKCENNEKTAYRYGGNHISEIRPEKIINKGSKQNHQKNIEIGKGGKAGAENLE
jgi:hypothetical protein